MARNTFNFTQARIKAVIPPEPGVDGKERRASYYDETQPKLKLLVSSTGAKRYYISKKNQAGKLLNVLIGKTTEWTVDDARIRASEILTEINKGGNPNKEKKEQKIRSMALNELIEHYIENHDLKPRTIDDYRAKTKWGFSDWLSKPASDITEKMIRTRHKKLSEKGKTATNDAFVRLRAVFNYGHAIGAIDTHNPVTILSTARLWHKRNQRKEIIPSSQLNEWLGAVDQITPDTHRVAFRMMLFMGFRIMETYELEWKDVDLDNEIIVQRDTKNRTDHELPIPSILISDIDALHEQTGEHRYLFPSKLSNDKEKHLTYPKKAIGKINNQIGFHFHPHMTRHTFTTVAEAVGIPKTMIDRLTNHTTTNDVTSGYIHTELETLRDALNKIAAYIVEHSTEQKDKVVKLYG